jgi:hypothetical protein
MTAHGASDLPLRAYRSPGTPSQSNATQMPRVAGRPRPLGHMVYQKGKSSEPSVVSPALWLPEFDS